MSVPPPPDDRFNEPDPDDADTGPLHIETPSQPVDYGSGPWAGRFDTPVMVSPRPVAADRRLHLVRGAVAVVVLAVVGGLIFWMVRPSADTADSPNATSTTSVAAKPDAEAQGRLFRMLPAGYPAASCEAADAPKDALAQVNCGENDDPGGPPSGTYTLVRDKAALDAAFNETVAASTRVDCPGNIQSPGPWRRNATPQKTSGVLFCGVQGGRPTVAWTDDARLVVSAVQAGPQGPTFDQLYAWWSSHS
jgi:hypothetical protein